MFELFDDRRCENTIDKYLKYFFIRITFPYSPLFSLKEEAKGGGGKWTQQRCIKDKYPEITYFFIII